jgi:cytochrome c oxidase subunit 2
MIKFLVFIAIVLFVIAVAQLMRVFELSSTLRGGKREAVTESDNRMNGKLWLWFMVAFFIFCIWQLVSYKDRLLPIAASEHGAKLDTLMNVNLVIITIVFVITNFFLFWFAYKYYGRTGQKATYYPHNNKLELLWTTIPAIVLAFIIIYGLKTWNSIMSTPDEGSMVVELYSKQFDWTARYAGIDNQLGKTNYKLIDEGANPLGVDSTDQASWDDLIIKNEFHIPVGKEVAFKFRSRDVIHSAFMPHFRAQMNTVPGMVTAFHFTPTITTEEMRKITGKADFDYILLCNKICGPSHYNMQMTIVVDKQADYDKWIAEQQKSKRFRGLADAGASKNSEGNGNTNASPIPDQNTPGGVGPAGQGNNSGDHTDNNMKANENQSKPKKP